MVSDRVSRVEHAHLEIKHRIMNGAYPPGAPLSESKLARMLRTSRTPVREALSRLLQEGYVERVPARGYFVAQITVTLIQNVFQVRRLLEGAAAARAAEFADPDAVRRARQNADFRYVLGDTASLHRAQRANTEFHLAIAGGSRNALLADLIRDCLNQVTRFIALGVNLEPLQGTASREHHAVVDAIERHDPEGARHALEHHLDNSSRLMMKALVRGEVRAVTV
jgi:DNA-binding GntR family transcriptional regulator